MEGLKSPRKIFIAYENPYLKPNPPKKCKIPL